MRETKITRAALVRYAGLLGPDSIAARALREYDHFRAQGDKVSIMRRNASFALVFGPEAFAKRGADQ